MSEVRLQQQVLIDEKNTYLVESTIPPEGKEPEVVMAKKNMRTHEYMKRIINQLQGSSNILPSKCRYREQRGKYTLFILEDVPRIRPTHFHINFTNFISELSFSGVDLEKLKNVPKKYDGNVTTLNLSYPFIIYFVVISNERDAYQCIGLKTYFRIHPLKRINDYLFYPNMLNFGENGFLCFGGNMPSFYKSRYYSEAEVASEILNLFWNKPFTWEYTNKHLKYKDDPYLSNFLMWAWQTTLNPHFGLSAKWLVYEENLEQEIQTTFLQVQKESESVRFASMFINPITNFSCVIEKSRMWDYDNIILDKSEILSTGDEITYEGKQAYIYNFIGDTNGPVYVILSYHNGDLSKNIEITDQLKSDWCSQLRARFNNYLEEVNIGNKHIKVGDIIKIIPIDSYECITKIRKLQTGSIEIIIGNRIFVPNDNNFETMDVIKIGNAEIKPGQIYLICNNQHQTIFRGKLVRVGHDGNHTLHLYFKDVASTQEKVISADLIDDGDILLISENSSQIMTARTFRYLDYLYTNDNDNYVVLKDLGVYIKNESNLFTSRFTPSIAYPDILMNDRKKLFIPSFDKDIEFCVGDKVILGDWNNQNLMFKIFTIESFLASIRDGLRMNLRSGNETHEIEYIAKNGQIKVGYVRKVTDELNGIKAGSKIRAVKSGIPEFPKKDINEIVAFVIDSEEPIVFLKSGLTMWFKDLQDFEIISSGSKTVKAIKEFNPVEIKWQTGDLLMKNHDLFLLNDDNPQMGIIFMQIDPNFVRTGSLRGRAVITDPGVIDPSFNRYGIPDPRCLKKDINVIYDVIPDFHNGFSKIPFDGYYPYTIREGVEKD